MKEQVTARQFELLLGASKMTRTAFALAYGVDRRQVGRWCEKHVPVPMSAALVAAAIMEIGIERLQAIVQSAAADPVQAPQPVDESADYTESEMIEINQREPSNAW